MQPARDTQSNEASNKPPENELGEIGASAETPRFKPRPPRLLHWLAIIVVVLVLCLGVLLGWLWWRDRYGSTAEQNTTSQNQGAEQSGVVCPENFVVYANQDLNLEFCYPQAWGEPAVSDASFASTDTGSRWQIGFSAKPTVHAVLVSTDWSTVEARETVCADAATQALPASVPSATEWVVEIENDTAPPSASRAQRGIDVRGDGYTMIEQVDDLLINGVCLSAYQPIGNATYPLVTATYQVDFTEDVPNPQVHIDESDVLIPFADRADFALFVRSIRNIEG